MAAAQGSLEFRCTDRDWQEIEAQCRILDDSQLWISDLSLSTQRGQGADVAYELGVQPTSARNVRAQPKFTVVMESAAEEGARRPPGKRSAESASMRTLPSNAYTGSRPRGPVHTSDVFPVSRPSPGHEGMACRRPRPMRLALSDNRQDSLPTAQEAPGLPSPALSASSSSSSRSLARTDLESLAGDLGREEAVWPCTWSGNGGGLNPKEGARPRFEVELVGGSLYPPLEVDFVDGALDDATYTQPAWAEVSAQQGWRERATHDYAPYTISSALSPRFSAASRSGSTDWSREFTPYQTHIAQDLHSHSDRWASTAPSDGAFSSGRKSCFASGSHSRQERDLGRPTDIPSAFLVHTPPQVSPCSCSSSSGSSRAGSGNLDLAGKSKSLDVSQAHSKFSALSPSSAGDGFKPPCVSPGSEGGAPWPGCRAASLEGRSSAAQSPSSEGPRKGAVISPRAWSAIVPSLASKIQRQPSVGPTIVEEEEGDGSEQLYLSRGSHAAPSPGQGGTGLTPPGKPPSVSPRMSLMTAMSGHSARQLRQGQSAAGTGGNVPQTPAFLASDRSAAHRKAPQAPQASGPHGQALAHSMRELRRSNSANERQDLGEVGLMEAEGKAKLTRCATNGTRPLAQAGAERLTALPGAPSDHRRLRGHSLSPCVADDYAAPKMPKRPVYLGSSNSSRMHPLQQTPSKGDEEKCDKAQPAMPHANLASSYKPSCTWAVLPVCAVDRVAQTYH